MEGNPESQKNSSPNEEANIEINKILTEVENLVKKNGNITEKEKNDFKEQLKAKLKQYNVHGNESEELYEFTAKFCLEQILPEKTKPSDDDILNKIDVIVRNNVKGKKSLKQIIDIIQRINDTHLSDMDTNIIERKYMNFCLYYFTEECMDFIKVLIKNNDIKTAEKILQSLKYIQKLEQVPEEFQMNYYTLLMDVKYLLSEKREIFFLKKLKEHVFYEISELDSMNEELDFLQKLIEYINTFKHPQSFAKLRLKDFCNEEISFKTFIKQILDLDNSSENEALESLQEMAYIYRDHSGIFMFQTYKKELLPYTIQPNVKYIVDNDKRVILIEGKVIVVSEILDSIEELLSKNNKIEEIRFIGSDIIHIDTNIKNDLWAGKNIFIYARKMIVYGEVVWNISGKNQKHRYINSAPDGVVYEDGTGGKGVGGQDGYAGESGGNVLIDLIESVEVLNTFKIISNGGSGSNGQNGGKGANGKDGVGINKDRAREMRTINHVDSCRNYTPKEFATAFNFNNLRWIDYYLHKYNTRSFMFKLGEFAVLMFSGGNILLTRIYRETYNMYLKSKYYKKYEEIDEETGCTVKFTKSILDGECFENSCQYLLIEGTKGKLGGAGGGFGYGGEGGQPGEIKLKIRDKIASNYKNIIITNNKGQDGKNGTVGNHGTHGNDGHDMGHISIYYWNKAIYFGEYDEKAEKEKKPYTKSKLKITEVLTTNPKDKDWKASVYCQKLEKYVTLEEVSIIDPYKRVTPITPSRPSRKVKQEHTKAIPTKPILESELRMKYSHHFHFLNTLLGDSEETSVDEINQDYDINVERFYTRIIGPSNTDNNVDRNNTDQNSIMKNRETDIEFLIEELTHGTFFFENWFDIKKYQLNEHQLEKLFQFVQKMKNTDASTKIDNDKIKQIEQILIEKYRAVTLKKIAQKITVERIHFKEQLYIKPKRENFYHINHHELGFLKHYFQTNNTKQKNVLIKYYNSLFVKTDGKKADTLTFLTKKFILSEGSSEKANLYVKIYYNKYDEFIKKQIDTHTKYENLIKVELSKKKNHDLLKHLPIEDFEDPELMKTIMKKNNELTNLYFQYLTYIKNKETFNWKECYMDTNIQDLYIKLILKQGVFFKGYLDLLSHIFQVNIDVYTQDKNGNYILSENHEATSLEKINVLNDGKEFKELIIIKIEDNLHEIDFGKYLTKSETSDSYEIRHFDLQSIYLYLFENDRSNVKRFNTYCEQKFENNIYLNYLEQSLQLFITENVKLTNVHPDIKKCYDDYQAFIKKNENNLKQILSDFEKIICKSKYSYIFNLYIKTNKDILNEEIQEEIMNKKELKNYVEQYRNVKNRKFRWIKYWNDNIQNEYMRDISNGTLSNTYIELLSLMFEVNINVYTVDKNKKYTLYSQHNSSSSQKLYVAKKKNGKIIKLDMNEEYLNLDKDRILKSKFYIRILTDVHLFDSKQELDDYVENEKYFLYDNNFNKYTVVLNTYNVKEKDDINAILKHFSIKNEKEAIGLQLNKLSSRYIGQYGILHHICYRFNIEGRHISFLELQYLINVTLNSFITDKSSLFVYCWIFAIYPQQNWIDEVLLFNFENYFKKALSNKPKWREYLSKINNLNILLSLENKLFQTPEKISFYLVDSILEYLNKIPDQFLKTELEYIELPEWLFILKDTYMKYKLSTFTQWSDEKLDITSYYMISLSNSIGNLLIEQLIDILENKDKLNEEQYFSIFLHFYNVEWNLNIDVLEKLKELNIKEWIKLMNDNTDVGKERDVRTLTKIIAKDNNTSDSIKKNLLSIEKIVTEMKIYIDIHKDMGVFVDADLIKDNPIENFKNILQLINIHIYQLGEDQKFTLRDTQNLSVLFLLVNANGTLLQMSTGEGKTFVIVAAAIITAMINPEAHIDIITSSSVLAKRDVEENRVYYEKFGISVAHNCSENIEDRKKAYQSRIVYGELSNFQRDYLLHHFYKKNILGDRNFNTVFVDEVDSLLLDQGNNVLYLSRPIAGFDKLDAVFLFIWQWINKPSISKEDIAKTLDTQLLKSVILSDIFGLLTQDMIQLFDPSMNKQKVKKIWMCLRNKSIIDQEGKLLKQNMSDEDLDQILSPDLKEYQNRLSYILKELFGRVKTIRVPNFLKPFIVRNLESWIESAKTALSMREYTDYVIDLDRTDSKSELHANIIILDTDTGADQASSQWENGLHQFLQLKHSCRLSVMSLKAVFISNVTYFKNYNKICGLTGTLGSEKERELLKKIHNVDFVTMPTYKPKQFVEINPILCNDVHMWKEKILSETKRITQKENRSVLIICETIENVVEIKEYFNAYNIKNVHIYKRDYEKLSFGKGLGVKEIIIATNLAGRGTNIKINTELKNNGGLHVCLTYLPKNIRVELQAFGRTSRKGNKGTGQLIIIGSDNTENNTREIYNLKKERDKDEQIRLREIQTLYYSKIVNEEECLKQISEIYRKTDNKENKDMVNPHELLLDIWSMWLDENQEDIKKTQDHRYKSKVESSMRALIQKYNHMVEKRLYFNPFREMNKESYIDQLIKDEPLFCEAAYYYKAYLKAKENEKFSIELENVRKLIDEHFYNAAFMIETVKQYREKSLGISQVDGFKAQKENVNKIYSIFINSINKLLGTPIKQEQLISEEDDKQYLAPILYQKLMDKGVLTCPKIKENISEKDLKETATGYLTSAKNLYYVLKKYVNGIPHMNNFIKDLQDNVHLPSREGFWEESKRLKVLINETEFVAIKKETLKNSDDFIKIIVRSINLMTIKGSDIITLYPEKITKDYNLYRTIDIPSTTLEMLKERGILEYNKMATFLSKEITPKYSYSSISLRNFDETNVMASEVHKILKNLVEQNIIKEDNYDYRLNIDTDEIENIKLPEFPIYENVVKILFKLYFSYQIAYIGIKKQLEAKTTNISWTLLPQPHNTLAFDILDQNFITAVKYNPDAQTKDQLTEIIESLDIEAKYTINYLEATLPKFRKNESLIYSLYEIWKSDPDKKESNVDYYQEMDIFKINSFYQYIVVKEKEKEKSILGPILVMVLGFVQVLVGVLIIVLSHGALMNVGMAFISEGVNDIFYGINALITGEFSWADYGKQKLASLAVTAGSMLMGGFPLASGSKLIGKFQAFKTAVKVVIKEIGKKVTKLFKDTILPMIIKMIGEAKIKIIKTILNGIKSSKYLYHTLKDIIKQIYDTKKKDEILKNIQKVIDKKFESKNTFYKMFKTVTTKLSKISRDISNNMKDENSTVKKILNMLSIALKYLVNTVKYTLIINNIIKKITHVVQSISNALKQIYNIGKEIHSSIEAKGIEAVIEDTKLYISVTIEKIIKSIIHNISDTCENEIRENVMKINESRMRNKMESTNRLLNLKSMSRKQKLNLLNKERGLLKRKTMTITEIHVERYKENVRSLLTEIKKSILYADLVREEITIDRIHIKIYAFVLSEILKINNVENPEVSISIYNKGNKNNNNIISTTSDDTPSTLIELELENDKFQIHSNIEKPITETQRNNSFYDALPIPLRSSITNEDFIVQFVEFIESNPAMEKIIHENILLEVTDQTVDELTE